MIPVVRLFSNRCRRPFVAHLQYSLSSFSSPNRKEVNDLPIQLFFICIQSKLRFVIFLSCVKTCHPPYRTRTRERDKTGKFLSRWVASSCCLLAVRVLIIRRVGFQWGTTSFRSGFQFVFCFPDKRRSIKQHVQCFGIHDSCCHIPVENHRMTTHVVMYGRA